MTNREPKRSILVVEDDVSAAEALTTFLASVGYEVLTANDGDVALRVAHERRPNVVLTDLALPTVDGYALLEELHATHPEIPVMVMTESGEIASALRAMRAGAENYLEKPLDLDALAVTLDRVLAGPQLRTEAEAFFALSLDMLCIAGFDGFFKRVNAAWERTLGWTTAELASKPWIEFVHPDDRESTRHAADKLVVAGAKVASFANRYRCRDGSFKWLAWSALPIPRAGTIYAVARDVTESKLAQEAIERSRDELATRVAERTVALTRETAERRSLEEERRKFMLGAERATDAIFMTEPDGTLTYVNPAFEKLYGFTSAEVVGKTPRVLKSGVQDRRFYERFWATLLAGEVVSCEVVNKTKDGVLLDIEVSANPILDERGAIIGFLAIHRDITERKRNEEALRESEDKYRLIFDSSAQGILIADIETKRFRYANSAMCTMLGYTEQELTQMGVEDIHPKESLADVLAAFEHLAKRKTGTARSIPCLRKDRTVFYADITTGAVVIGGRQCNVGFFMDLTERKKAEAARDVLERQFRQAQKMEAVGRLAGGVAHDFNNVLSVILSYAEMIAADLKPEEPLHQDISEVRTAALRAAELTRHLLAFSRQQVLEPRVMNLNHSIASIEKLLGRLLGEDIELAMLVEPKLWNINADPGQIEQIMMNLCVNARDAMPTGGKLTIETANIDLDEDYARLHVDVQPGAYVMLAVSDTGVGMTPETQARIFEPFFTTKEQGKGTGLGLATVFGIVKQSGGHIWVYSEPGNGASFKVFFPRATGAAAVRPSLPPTDSLRGNETILLVEDDAQVRVLARNVLRRNGYVVLEASNGGEALLICEKHGAKIDLLLTDVILPLMSGREIAERVKAMRAEMKVLYMSGYAGDAVRQHGVLDSDVAFLQKPFTPASLTRKVRETIQEKNGE